MSLRYEPVIPEDVALGVECNPSTSGFRVQDVGCGVEGLQRTAQAGARRPDFVRPEAGSKFFFRHVVARGDAGPSSRAAPGWG